MGAKGSGRTKASWDKLKYEQAAAGNQTPETKEYFNLLRRQMGDRLWEVQRVYPSGKKAVLGTVQNLKADTVGKMFGAGEYELFEMDRGTGDTTAKPPIKRILHPGKYPLIEKYAKDPMDAELEMNPPAAPAHVTAAAAAAGDLSSMTPAQIFASAEASALEKFQKAQELKDLKDQLGRLELAIAQRNAAPAGTEAASSMAQLRDMMAIFKEMMPAPIPNGINMPMNPLDTVRQGVEALKLFQSELSGLGVQGLGAAKPENSALPKLIETLGNIAQAAIPALAGSRPLPVQRAPVPALAPAPVTAGAGGGAGAAAAAPAPPPAPAATAAPAPALASEDAKISMLTELGNKLRQDQADQLAVPPRSHVNSTVAWIRQRMQDPAAGDVWHNLPNVLNAFSEPAVVQYIAGTAPDLADSDAKRNWLFAVVDLLKKPA